ncbi:hypothetical protein PVAND_014713 [Polypedilum vanderplanki]|uniref:Nose resistant-to-fluoxetine protein N-terminal domain-containing protein n=1 Tax=Polypedilum vanderplanki TaxID=319348 RepID=A0A9J6BAH5_POLVA|nr:hypothetical protein PVAND_014713 [Polypedilum vanderplanki]
MKKIVLFLLHFSLVFSHETNDEICEKQLNFYQESLNRKENWAIQLFDAWTKLQSGINSGNIVDFGHYDQCLDFYYEASVQNKDIQPIQGQYCVIYYRATVNSSQNIEDEGFQWNDIGSIFRESRLRLAAGVCLPTFCSVDKIQEFVNNYLSTADVVITGDYDQSLHCRTNELPSIETIDVVAIVIIAVLICLLTSSTIYEVFMIKKNRKRNPFLEAFSLYKNGKKLIEMKEENSPNVIKCLSALRTFAMLHILIGHRYLFWQAHANVNMKSYQIGSKWSNSIMGSLIDTNHMAVDTFFVMGGLLLAKSTFSAIEKKIFNIARMYFHRYLRSMPVLGFLVLVTASIFKFFGNGPLFKSRSRLILIDSCKERWWATIFYFHNFYKPVGSCVEVSWYLAVDYQLVLISPLILYPIYKWGWKFMWIIPSYILGTIIWNFTAVHLFDFTAFLPLMKRDKMVEYFERLYSTTYLRCAPWMIGVLLGYYLYKLKGEKITINKYLNAALWILSFSILISIVLGSVAFRTIENQPSTFANAFYIAFRRQSWGLAIAWIIFACEMNSGGIVKKFLELPCWQPLGRISLSFYLIHTFLQILHLTSIKVPLYFSDISLWHQIASDFIASVILASVLYLTLEEPILQLESNFYKWNAMRKTKSARV